MPSAPSSIPDRAIADVRALLGADSDLVIAALANAPSKKNGPPWCLEHLAGPDPIQHTQDRTTDE